MIPLWIIINFSVCLVLHFKILIVWMKPSIFRHLRFFTSNFWCQCYWPSRARLKPTLYQYPALLNPSLGLTVGHQKHKWLSKGIGPVFICFAILFPLFKKKKNLISKPIIWPKVFALSCHFSVFSPVFNYVIQIKPRYSLYRHLSVFSGACRTPLFSRQCRESRDDPTSRWDLPDQILIENWGTPAQTPCK